MTTDANNPEVTRAYRDLATETTPAKLDDKILDMAAREARPRYGVARAWIRPVAWAATIGLSLIIVLEVTRMAPPVAEDLQAEPALERQSADEAPAPARGERAKREDAAESPAAAAPVLADTPANPGGGGAEEMHPRPAESKETRAAELDDADAFVAKDLQMLEEAEEQARHRAGEVASFAAVSVDVTATSPCDEIARASADSWYECIEELRDAGESEAADNELEALQLAFPDFEEPETDK